MSKLTMPAAIPQSDGVRRLIGALLALLLVTVCPPALAGEREFTTSDGTDIPIETREADGSRHIIWFPSEDGPQDSEQEILDRLAGLGVSSWRVDLVGARFMPMVQSSQDQLPATDVSELLQHAIDVTGKKVALVSTGRGVIPLLRGVHQWQGRHRKQAGFAGLVLLSPKFFVETPDPGQASELMPVVSRSNAPIVILQAGLSPWYWKLDQTVPALKKSGSDVVVTVLPEVRDRFYFRPETTAAEQDMIRALPRRLNQALQALLTLPAGSRQPAPMPKAGPTVGKVKKERVLKPYKGNPEAPPLKLARLDGKDMDINQLRGKVVLVNFWATWCPPCVHEMPSMESLQKTLADQPFVILAVNMAEQESVIRQFLKEKVRVSFPILLDADGAALKRWRVFAFPTSYVLDKQGRIRYALFGSYQWDQADAVGKIRELLREQE